MVLFPNCKINIGLDVIQRRSDGFHELSTLMFPVRGLCDALEIVPSQSSVEEFSVSGLEVTGKPDKNLCMRAVKLMRAQFGIPAVRMHLHKVIPMGAGLGGGSADGAFAIRGLNNVFQLGLNVVQMKTIAAQLGSDTSFFIENTPAIATGRGEILTSFPISLQGLHLVIAKPPVGVSTAEAYSWVKPNMPTVPLVDRLKTDVREWRELIQNDFEKNIFRSHPEIAELKEIMYDNGAIYASMSGSGSAVYGIFSAKPELLSLPEDTFVYQEVIG